MTFTVRPKNVQPATIDIQSEIIRGPSAVPARSETFKMFRIKSTQFPCVIESKEIAKDVFTSTTIAHKTECWLRVLNRANEIKIINTEMIKSLPLEQFYILLCRETSEKLERNTELTSLLSNKIPTHARDTLLPLCLEFSDIFHLEFDKPSTNNFYTRKLRLKDDEPVYVKNYRLPQSQKAEIDSQVKKLLKQELIEISTSNYNSPLIVVPKKSTGGKKNGECVGIIDC